MKGRAVIVAENIEAYMGGWSPRFPTMAQAKEWKRAQVTESEAQRTAWPKSSVTLADAWRAWLARAQTGSLHSRSGAAYKPVTLRDYSEAMENRILPDYGPNLLGDVTPHGLKMLVADLRESGLSASAIRNTINPLRALYRDADEVVDGWRGPNPTAGLSLPRVKSRRGRDRMPSPAQLADLVAHAPKGDRTLWATACYAGLRRGELRALRRRDVNLAAAIIHVRRSWDRVEREIEPKSEAGTRDVPIFALLRPHLEKHLEEMADSSQDALVFGTKTGGPFDGGDVAKRAEKAWKDKATRFTLHECRHGFASVCVEAGVGANPKRIQTWMGHSSIATTFDLYGRLLEGSEAEWVSKVDAYLARGTAVGPKGAESGGTGRQLGSDVNEPTKSPKALSAA